MKIILWLAIFGFLTSVCPAQAASMDFDRDRHDDRFSHQDNKWDNLDPYGKHHDDKDWDKNFHRSDDWIDHAFFRDDKHHEHDCDRRHDCDDFMKRIVDDHHRHHDSHTCENCGVDEVPLPASLPLFASALLFAGLLAYRYKRKAA